MADEAYRFPLTIKHLLDNAVATSAGREIVYRDQVRYDYSRFRERIGRLAALLASVGACEGTTVAVMDWDSHRYLEAYFAVPMMGAVLFTVNVRLTAAQIAYTLQHSNTEVLLVHRDFLPMVESLLDQLPAIRAVIAIADGVEMADPDFARGEYEQLLAAAPDGFEFRDFDENALATTFYTTGTTGNPKGVCFSHRQIVLHTLAAKAPFGVTRGGGLGHGDTYMPLTPMFHVHAWGMPYIATLLGLKQVYPGRYEPRLILDLKLREGVTYSHCVPTVVRMILDAAVQRESDLSGWTLKIGGSALTVELCTEASKQGMVLISGYGMSETAPIIGMARWRKPDENEDDRIASMVVSGVPVPLVSARIVDSQMNVLPTDGTAQGELVLRAPWLTPCYVGDEAASDTLWRGGWMHTQDVATIDPDGTIIIRDRLKDVIKTGGEWLSSLDLEKIIARADGVGEVAVVGIPHDRWVERPIAIVTRKYPGSPTLESVNACLSAAIAAGEASRFALLDRLQIVDALPRTSVGKIDKKKLREIFLRDGSFRDSSSSQSGGAN
jgi:fatty-acyl-CoA synthase